jgi:2-C-methyl-D-erythritol 4-phosphate cytidylyltransferase
MSGNGNNVSGPQKALKRKEAHRIRKNMAGLVERSDIWERIVVAAQEKDEEEFKQACRDAGITTSDEVIEDAEEFIDQLWKATKYARQRDSIQPCW